MRTAVASLARGARVRARGERYRDWRRARARGAGALWGAAALCAVAAVLALSLGPSGLGLSRLARIALAWLGVDAAEPATALERALLVHVRAPRAVLAALTGATLAACGAALQALLRNPLVEPGLVGTSAGASFGAVAWIVLGVPAAGGALATLGLAGAAFLGGLVATGLVLALARPARGLDGTVLLLAGVALTAILGAGTGLLLFSADDAALRDATFWSLGSLARASWPALAVAAPCLVVASAGVLAHVGALDALLLGEPEAAALGIDVLAAKRRLVLLAALGVGAAVALGGTIGFVGLVVPHVARLLVGAGHRVLLPLSLLLGAAALLLADAVARTAASPAELPIGVVTSAVGGPFFLALLLARHRPEAA